MSAGTFTFLHAADLHIDSPLRGLGRYETAPASRLRSATRVAFSNLVDTALDREVDFVVIAGDVFDGDWKDSNTGLWFQGELLRLTGAGIPVYLLRGNHDARSAVSKGLSLPDGVHRFPESKPRTFRIKDLGVALHGQGFADREERANLAAGYPEPVEGAFNIGVLHTSMGGYEGHDSYAPCTEAELTDRGYDYWALGHVHTREEVRRGDPWIVYPGNIQGRHARETGPKGASLVSVDEGRVAGVEALVLDEARWARVEVDVGAATGPGEAVDMVRAGLEAASDAAEGRLLAARVMLTGTTPLDGTLRVERERLEAEVRAAALEADGDIWVEKVRLGTKAPERPGDREAAGLSALGERIREAELEAEEQEGLAVEVTGLIDRLPPGLRERLDASALVGRSLAPAAALLAAHLSGSKGFEDGDDGGLEPDPDEGGNT